MDAPSRRFVSDYLVERRALTTAQFLDRHPHPFLVLDSRGVLERTEISPEKTLSVFREAMHEFELDLLRSVVAEAGKPEWLLVLAVRKGGGGPDSDSITVGRVEDNDVVIPSSQVSRLHAFFRNNEDDSYSIVDARASNGTFVGPLRLGPRESMRIESGDILTFGDVRTEYYEAPVFLAYLDGFM